MTTPLQRTANELAGAHNRAIGEPIPDDMLELLERLDSPPTPAPAS